MPTSYLQQMPRNPITTTSNLSPSLTRTNLPPHISCNKDIQWVHTWPHSPKSCASLPCFASHHQHEVSNIPSPTKMAIRTPHHHYTPSHLNPWPSTCKKPPPRPTPNYILVFTIPQYELTFACLSMCRVCQHQPLHAHYTMALKPQQDVHSTT